MESKWLRVEEGLALRSGYTKDAIADSNDL
jgi:hypothetical protein